MYLKQSGLVDWFINKSSNNGIIYMWEEKKFRVEMNRNV